MNVVDNILRNKKSIRRQNKLYKTGLHGIKIRFHRVQNPSLQLINAMEEFVDQISNRKSEWGLVGSNSKEGYTDLTRNVIRNHNLSSNDINNFITELKIRKYSIDYNNL